MAAKTYVPSANTLATALHFYLTRYQTKLSAGKTADQIAALAELISCLVTFIEKWPKPEVNP